VRPRFFKSAAELRAWLTKHHDQADELWVGMYKKATGKPTISHREAVDEALCFGWIDGVRKGIDEQSFRQRFTPRRPGSNWSAINIKRAEELEASGRMRAPGRKAFQARDPAQAGGRYSYEEGPRELAAEYTKAFRGNRRAWKFFSEQPPGYRRTASWWVMSAKREDTRRRRLATLIDDSANGRRLAMLAPQRT